MKIPKYIVFRVDVMRKGTSVELTNITDDVEDVILKAEQTEPQSDERVGEWVWTNERKNQHKCSVCGELAYTYYDELADNVEELFDYCPYCGADMRAEQTEPQTEMPELKNIGEAFQDFCDKTDIGWK